MSDSSFTCDDISTAVEALSDEGLQWLQDLIAFETVQGNEAEAQAYMKDLLTDLGFEPEYREIPDTIFDDPEYSHGESEQSYEGRHNLVTNWGADEGRSVIAQAHIDVVPGGDWDDAFNPSFDGEFVHGRGAMDDKGQIVMKVMAMKALKDIGFEPKGRIESQIVIEEEVGGNGALALIRQGCDADGVIVFEGTTFDVFPANRGAIWFELTTTGKSLHMGRRHEGVNAIEKMMEAIDRILDYEEELIESSRNYPLFERYEAPVQVCLGKIRGGDWPSMVCGECTLEGGVGFLPNKNMDQIKDELQAAIESSDDEWLKEHYELTYPKLHNDAYEIDPDHPIVQTMHGAALDCDLDSEVYGWNVSCDDRLYNKLAGLPTIVFGVDDIAAAHGPDEKVKWSEVVKGAKAVALALARWTE
ncbi:MAG: ArgE/DapE family deacylase [Armatimonadota bacterium]